MFFITQGEGYHAKKLFTCQTNGNEVDIEYVENADVKNEFGFRYSGNWLKLKEKNSLHGLLEKFIQIDLNDEFSLE